MRDRKVRTRVRQGDVRITVRERKVRVTVRVREMNVTVRRREVTVRERPFDSYGRGGGLFGLGKKKLFFSCSRQKQTFFFSII